MGLATYDDQDDVSVDHHYAMSPGQRVAYLGRMLRFERQAAGARRVDASS